jgi:excisionase family DNA binding protein
MLKVSQLNQYDEVAQRINRLLHEAAQRGHIAIPKAQEPAVPRPPANGSNGRKTGGEDTLEAVVCEYLTPRDVAAVLNLSTDTVYTMLREGELPAIRLGAGKRQVWRIPLIEFREYLTAIRTGPEFKR